MKKLKLIFWCAFLALLVLYIVASICLLFNGALIVPIFVLSLLIFCALGGILTIDGLQNIGKTKDN